MKKMKRVLSAILCLTMLVGLIPGNALTAMAAEGTPTIVIAGSDYQKSNSGTTMQNIMNKIKETHSSVYGILMGGDYDAGDVYPNSSHLTAVNTTINAVYSGIADENRIFIQGNHETYGNLSPSNNDLLDATGEHDTDYYGVYAINYEDFENAASGLQNYLNGKSGYTKPIFVMSHQPLHVTSRGDNNAAVDLFNVLNNYDDLNIIFLFGHNHSGGYDAYLGNGSIYLPKGSSITVAGGSTETLNFTYMNYGYVGYVNGSADTTLTMSVFEIYEDEVLVKRYDTNGLHNLKAAGATVNGYNTDSNVYGTAVIDLSTGESTISAITTDSGEEDSDTNDGTTDDTTGGSGYTYELVTSIEAGEKYVIVGNDDAVALMDNGGSMGSQSVNISGTTLTSDVALTEWTFASESSGTITSDEGNQLGYSSSSWNLDGDGDCTFDIAAGSSNFSLRVQRSNLYSSRYYFYYDGSEWAKDSSSTQYIRLYKLTGNGGGSTVTPEGGDWVTISDGTGATIYTLDEDGLNVGSDEKYLIVDKSTDDTGNVLTNSNGTAANTTVTITDKVIKVNDDSNVAWTPTGSSSSANFANGSYNIYLSYNNGVLYTSSRSLNVTHKGNGEYTLQRDSNSSGYYVQYNSEDGWDTLSTSENSVYLFRKTGTESAGDAEYAKLEGELTYTVKRGASSDEALKAVMSGIDVLTSVNADGSDYTTLDDSNTDITWTLTNYDSTVAGEYAVTISYKGIKLGTAKVIVPEVTITGYDCEENGSVRVGASGNVKTGANITVYLEDGTSYTVPVTMNMLTKDGVAVSADEADVITGVTVTYNGVVICEDFTLTVREPASYPEYPDEGAVRVNKTSTGVQFQSTGVAQVEVSASGIPMNQGVDVLLVLDTSSSMGMEGSLTDGRTRIDVLKECVNALIVDLKAERADGSIPNVDIAIVDFNGYTGNKNTNYIGSTARSTSTLGGVLIGIDDGDVDEDGWVDVQNLSDTWATSNIPEDGSGTNYDHGLLQAYDLLKEKQEKDGGSRKQFVLFMSDGAPFQYNGVNSNSLSEDWEDWILGSYSQEDVEAIDTIENKDFYYGYNEGNGQKHRVAEAIKGLSSDKFEIVTYSDTSSSGTTELEEVYGLGVTMYSVGLALEATNMPTDVAGQEAILKTIASSEDVFYSVTSAAGLQEAFDDFSGEVLMAATNARFVDQMGDAYDLEMGTIKDINGNAVEGVENKIEILSYDIWTRADYLDGDVTADKIGDRKGTYTVLETVTFNEDGSEAYSDKDSIGPNGETITAGSNILIEGIIYANSFWYNSNLNEVEISGVDIPVGVDSADLTTGSTNILPAETFYWKVGTIKTTELAMRYYVYLTGSGEGTREAGSYLTNNYANLYYNNYLSQPIGQPCHMNTVSPVMAWKSANVSYAFYLVDENGNIIVNQTTGETGSFANKIAITNPVIFSEILLNSGETIPAMEVAEVLPSYYTPYDSAAVYNINVGSDNTGSWEIVKGDSVNASTYVMQYDTNNSTAYSKELNVDNVSYDYTHTVVWFAVLYTIEAHPDTVVIDYGLPVDISVLNNDMFGENGKLEGVGAYSSDTTNLDGYDETLASGFGTNYTGKYGNAEADTATGKVRYTPDTTEMNNYEKFAYAVNYTGASNSGYYYDTITVIPATTVYYEDEFVELKTYVKEEDLYVEKSGWDKNSVDAEAIQDEDRPGYYSLSSVDADNIYGYDSAYKNMSTHSMNNAAMVSVNANKYATATFTFYGTGFDVISVTSKDTGVLTVQVKDGNGQLVVSKMVDTYYGYTKDGEAWVVTDRDALYQIPVIKVSDLEYGQYTVTLRASYYDALNNIRVEGADGDGSYELYLDAIRIYNPAGTEFGTDDASDGVTGNLINTTIQEAYKADNEGWPRYEEVRNNVIDAAAVTESGATEINGIAFIDGVGETANVADYISYGPNNELYLKPGQAIAFNLTLPENIDKVHLAVKSADGVDVSYKIFDANVVTEKDDLDAITAKSVTTTSDLYYDITTLKDKTIVVYNSGTSGILSLTNIKMTFTSDPGEVGSVFYIAGNTINLITANMNEEPTFEPKSVAVKTSPSKIYAGNKITVTVTTSTDVEAISVNDKLVEKYYTRGGKRVWTTTIDAVNEGTEAVTQAISIVVYNGEGIASEPTITEVTVQADRWSNSSIGKIINTLFGWLFK